MIKIIAVTGGIGSGKSTVCKIIKELGYTVYSADETYKQMLKNKFFVSGIYKILGIKHNFFNEFNSKEISKAVFNNKELLEKLNNYTHPKIMKKMLNKSKRQKGIVFNEVPLLFENGYQILYDEVYVVERSLIERVNAVVKRDNSTKSEIEKRIKNQYNYENLAEITHTLIVNNGSLEELKQTVISKVNESKNR